MTRRVLLALASLAFGAPALSHPIAPQEAASPLHGVSIRAPDDWSVVRRADPSGGIALLFEPPGVPSGTVRVTVQVAFQDEPPHESPDGAFVPLDAGALRDRTLARTTARLGEPLLADATLAGLDARRCGFDVTSGAGTYRVDLLHAATSDRAIVVQCHAPADAFDGWRRAFDAIVASLEITPLAAEGRDARRLHALAARCGNDIRWAADFAEAAARAASADPARPVLVHVRSYPGFALADETRATLFGDPEIAGLVRERFVPVRLRAGDPSPLAAPERYGMSETTFGEALIVASPGGEVRCATFSMRPAVVHAMLVAVLARDAAVTDGGGATDLAGVGRAIARGDLAAAGRALQAADAKHPVARLLLAARLARLERRGDDALAALSAARALGPADAQRVRLDVEEARLRLARDETREVGERLDEVLARGGGGSGRDAAGGDDGDVAAWRAEAAYWRGHVCAARGDRAEAERWWRQLALAGAGATGAAEDAHGAADAADAEVDAWRFRAAAALTSTSFAAGVPIDRPAWPAEEVFAAVLREADAWPALPALGEEVAAAAAARAFLLGSQRADGSWVCPAEIGFAGSGPSLPFTAAITALAARALLPWRGDAAVARAIGGGERFLAGAMARARLAPAEALMDYRVWSRACTLRFLAARVRDARQDPAAREHLAREMARLVGELAAQQRPGGGWSYFVSGVPGEAGAGESFSFVTAAVVLALLDARESGADVPDHLVAPALDLLEAMRHEDGSFAYMLAPGASLPRVPTGAGVIGASGRGPLCALALARGGRTGTADVRAALDSFLRHAPLLVRARGKDLMHAGPGGLGCHYVLFDLASAAEAAACLPKDERGAVTTELLALLEVARSKDGTWLDMPMMGRPYGTAMALLALASLNAAQ